MPALPPDRPGAPRHASGGPAAGLPGGTGPAGPGAPGCPCSPARPRAPAGPRPLPDPAAVRLHVIPDSAPPYDGETAAARRPGPAAAVTSAGQDHPGMGDSPGAPRPSGTRDSAGIQDSSAGQDSSASQDFPVTQDSSVVKNSSVPRAQADPPVLPPGWPSRFAQVLAETLAGSRPPRQLAPWTTERARDRIQRLGPQLSAGQQPRVRRVVTFRPTADAVEMTVVVGFGMRVHALAVRLERADRVPGASGQAIRAGRWLCVAVEAA
jgi:Family of unknown function (DUF6459)